jgi:fused signal recognition particle receptor
MNELVKIHNVTLKVADSIPVKVVLNIDATTGQNGLKQAEAFKNIIPCDGIFLSKLDGTSKGGIVFPISQQLGIPILFVGTGESSEDIAFFDRDTFVDNMFTEPS